MGQARHPLSLLVLIAVLPAMAVAGCGSSGGGSSNTARKAGGGAPPSAAVGTCAVGASSGARRLRVSGADCALARGVAASWGESKACRTPAGGSRASCPVGGLRCQSVVSGSGLAVSCAAPSRAVSFVARRGSGRR